MYNTNNILSGKVVLAGDKSISHRLLMVGSLLKGECVIDNISLCDDVQSTIDCLRGCNVDIKINNNAAYIAGSSLSNPKKDLNCKNSGTAARLLLGLFAGQNISAKLIGDKSLSNRPMSRIIKPLIDAGAMIKSNNNNLPITIISGIKKPVVYKNKTKSAQVKSSLILSGLGLDNATYISYNQSTRDHLEKILKYLNFDINVGPSVCIRKSLKNKIKFNLYTPGDISNASFLIVAALIIPNSKIKIENVLYNKTRVGFINLLLKMGANIKISNVRKKLFEKICNIKVQYMKAFSDVDKREFATLLPLIVLTLVMGIYPEIFMVSIHISTVALLENIVY